MRRRLLTPRACQGLAGAPVAKRLAEWHRGLSTLANSDFSSSAMRSSGADVSGADPLRDDTQQITPNAVAQLLSAFGVFAIVGGVLVGHIGDTVGRRAALTFIIERLETNDVVA
jgi:MFS family permease